MSNKSKHEDRNAKVQATKENREEEEFIRHDK